MLKIKGTIAAHNSLVGSSSEDGIRDKHIGNGM